MFPEGRLLDFLIVGAVALIVVGPKDLPMLMRKVAQFMAKVRGMAAEFRASFDELARESELEDLRKQVESLRAARPETLIETVANQAGAPGVFSDLHSQVSAVRDDFHAAIAAEQATDVPIPPLVEGGQADTPLVADPAAPKPKRIRKPKAPAADATQSEAPPTDEPAA